MATRRDVVGDVALLAPINDAARVVTDECRCLRSGQTSFGRDWALGLSHDATSHFQR